MTTIFSEEQVKVIKEAQAEAEKLLKDSKAFDAKYEEIFTKFDKNKDGMIGLSEYVQFLNIMLASAGKAKADLSVAMLNFDRADKDKNGDIDKKEFKKEVYKRLQEFVRRKVQIIQIILKGEINLKKT